MGGSDSQVPTRNDQENSKKGDYLLNPFTNLRVANSVISLISSALILVSTVADYQMKFVALMHLSDAEISDPSIPRH